VSGQAQITHPLFMTKPRLVGADGGWGKPCGPDNAGLTNRFRRSRPTLSELPGGGLCQQTTLLAACKLWPLHARRLMSWHTV
jgi:hypothetical protein